MNKTVVNTLFICLFWLLSFEAKAQFEEYPFALPYYPMIAYDSNHIKHIASIDNFPIFYQKLSDVLQRGEGQINIVHIGGSHIQADYLTSRCRQRFQNFEGGLQSGRGFVFPYRMAKTNKPQGYYFSYTGLWECCKITERNKECSFGLGGISAYTIDTLASLDLYMESEYNQNFSFNHLQLFHSISSQSFEAVFDSELVDSIVKNEQKGCTEVYFNRVLDSVHITFRQMDTTQYFFQLYGMNVFNDNAGIIYHNIGINGASTSSFLRSKNMQDELMVIKPDLVIFAIGINDASGPNFSGYQFIKNYDSLIQKVYAANSDAAILFVTNNDSYLKRRYVNRNGVEVQQLMYKIASDHQAAVWDMFEIMGGSNSIVKWQKYDLAQPDRVHFTRSGYYLLGDLLFDALIQDYGRFLENSKANNEFPLKQSYR